MYCIVKSKNLYRYSINYITYIVNKYHILISILSGRKKRSLVDGNEVMLDEKSEYAFPFIKQISDMGITNLYKNKDCQQKLFCEMANYGSKRYALNDNVDLETPNLIQKTFNFVSNS